MLKAYVHIFIVNRHIFIHILPNTEEYPNLHLIMYPYRICVTYAPNIKSIRYARSKKKRIQCSPGDS